MSPDGRTIAARITTDNGDRSQLGLIDVATGSVNASVRRTAVGIWAWSPAGRSRILFARRHRAHRAVGLRLPGAADRIGRRRHFRRVPA
jgi:hypothetical protein